jgi:hypothetical protein
MDRRPHHVRADNLGLAVAADDHLPGLLDGQTLATGFRSAFFHGRAQADSFYGADFRKTGGADDEARFAIFSAGVLLPCHDYSIPFF